MNKVYVICRGKYKYEYVICNETNYNYSNNM